MCAQIATQQAQEIDDDNATGNMPDHISRTELDSHANMVVVGSNCYIIADTGRTAVVSPFTPDYDALQEVHIVDAALQYDDPYTGKETVLIVRNALHDPAMQHNLIPSFIMREAGGITVNDTPKIQQSQQQRIMP